MEEKLIKWMMMNNNEYRKLFCNCIIHIPFDDILGRRQTAQVYAYKHEHCTINFVTAFN